MDQKVEPIVREMVKQGLGGKKIADRLNDDGVPYYQKLPLKYRFSPRTPKKVLDSFKSHVGKRGRKHAFRDGSQEFKRYYRPPRNPAPWTAKKVRALCRRVGISLLSARAYGKIAYIRSEAKDRAEYLKREWGSRASKVIAREKVITARELARWGNEERKPDLVEDIIDRFSREARMRGS